MAGEVAVPVATGHGQIGQPVDFFGDGTRIPLMAVSKFTKPGHISHVYSDHVSVVKFIEYNWKLSPAIGDLFDLFDFGTN